MSIPLVADRFSVKFAICAHKIRTADGIDPRYGACLVVSSLQFVDVAWGPSGRVLIFERERRELRSNPHFDVLHGDHRFDDLVKRIGIPDWKDADPDIPILKQAKAEYAKVSE